MNNITVKTVCIGMLAVKMLCGADDQLCAERFFQEKFKPGVISAETLSFDGETFAHAIQGTVCLAKGTSGVEQGTVYTTKEAVYAIAFNPESSKIAVSCGDEVLIFLRESKICERRLAFAARRIRALSYSSDGETIAAGDINGDLILRRLSTPAEDHTIALGEGITAIAYAPTKDEQRLAVALNNGNIYILDGLQYSQPTVIVELAVSARTLAFCGKEKLVYVEDNAVNVVLLEKKGSSSGVKGFFECYRNSESTLQPLAIAVSGDCIFLRTKGCFRTLNMPSDTDFQKKESGHGCCVS